MNIRKLCALIFGFVLLVSNAQAGEPAPVDAFIGSWVGVGLKEDVTDYATGGVDYALRDLDVSIESGQTGLNITWTTHFLDTSEKKSTSITLVQTAPGVFVGTENSDVFNGGTAVWGRIEDRSLIVYVFEVDQNGIYDLSRYERRLSLDRMFLYFKRTRDGKTIRSVIGELVQADERHISPCPTDLSTLRRNLSPWRGSRARFTDDGARTVWQTDEIDTIDRIHRQSNGEMPGRQAGKARRCRKPIPQRLRWPPGPLHQPGQAA